MKTDCVLSVGLPTPISFISGYFLLKHEFIFLSKDALFLSALQS